MTVQPVAAGTGVLITTGTGTVSKSGCIAGNLIVAHYLVRGTTDDHVRSNAVNITNLAGTPTSSINPIATNRDVGSPVGSRHGFYAGRVTANGTCSVDFTVGASGNDILVILYEFSGEYLGAADDGIGLFDNDGATVQGGFGTGTTVSDRAVLTATDGELCVQLVALTVNQAIGAFAGETGGDWTEAWAEYQESGGATGTLQLQTAQKATAGTIDGGSATIGSSCDWGILAFGIIPAASPPQTITANSPVVHTRAFGSPTVTREQQVLIPSADSVDNGWTDQGGGTSLVLAIDETIRSDSDYIRSPVGPSNSGTRVKVASGTDPVSSVAHEIHWAPGKDFAGGPTINMTVKLYQGGGDVLGAGTLIASFARNNVSAFASYVETLSGAEADSITNYADLYLEFFANQV